MYAKFRDGLAKRGVDPDEVMKTWKYVGGNRDSHKNYFETWTKKTKKDPPPYAPECVCGHEIKTNCYISNDVEILVVGSCCIKRFMEHKTRTCSDCNAPHKNRKYNLCNECKQKMKEKEKEEKKPKCSDCGKSHQNRKNNLCWRCRDGVCRATRR